MPWIKALKIVTIGGCFSYSSYLWYNNKIPLINVRNSYSINTKCRNTDGIDILCNTTSHTDERGNTIIMKKYRSKTLSNFKLNTVITLEIDNTGITKYTITKLKNSNHENTNNILENDLLRKLRLASEIY